MIAAVALKAARAAGITVAVDGDDLVVAAPAEPAAEILSALRLHKRGVVRLLQSRELALNPVCRPACQKAVRGPTEPLPAECAAGFAALLISPPLEGFSARQWRQLIADAEHFLDQWAGEAMRQGWTTLDLFGVHIRAPAARYDVMGIVPMLRGGKVVALTANRATVRMPTGSLLVYLKRGRANAIPIWSAPASAHDAAPATPPSPPNARDDRGSGENSRSTP